MVPRLSGLTVPETAAPLMVSVDGDPPDHDRRRRRRRRGWRRGRLRVGFVRELIGGGRALVPPGVVTVTSTVPEPAGAFAVICDALLTVSSLPPWIRTHRRGPAETAPGDHHGRPTGHRTPRRAHTRTLPASARSCTDPPPTSRWSTRRGDRHIDHPRTRRRRRRDLRRAIDRERCRRRRTELTVDAPLKFVPVIVTLVPPHRARGRADPRHRRRRDVAVLIRRGRAAGASPVVTVTSTVPVPAGAVAVISSRC